MKPFRTCLWIGLLLWAAPHARAAMSIEWTGPATGSATLGWNGLDWIQQGQTFSLTEPWLLQGAEFDLSVNLGEPERFVATLRNGDNLSIDYAAVTGYSPSTLHPGWERFDFNSIELGPGNYAVVLSAIESFPAANAGFAFGFQTGVPGNRLQGPEGEWTTGSSDALYSFTFAAIPEPLTTGLLLAGGALLLAKQKQRAE